MYTSYTIIFFFRFVRSMDEDDDEFDEEEDDFEDALKTNGNKNTADSDDENGDDSD